MLSTSAALSFSCQLDIMQICGFPFPLLTFQMHQYMLRNVKKIVICGIIPRPIDHHVTEGKVKLINWALKTSCKGWGVLFRNPYKGFTKCNAPKLECFRKRYPGGRTDLLHLNSQGITQLRTFMKQILANTNGKGQNQNMGERPTTFINKNWT